MNTNNRNNMKLAHTEDNDNLHEAASKLNTIKQIIENEMSAAYKKYGKESTVEVEVSSKSVELWINSECPYMDKEFWVFLNETAKKIDGILAEHGFTYEKTKYFYDFVIWIYKRNDEAENDSAHKN